MAEPVPGLNHARAEHPKNSLNCGNLGWGVDITESYMHALADYLDVEAAVEDQHKKQPYSPAASWSIGSWPGKCTQEPAPTTRPLAFNFPSSTTIVWAAVCRYIRRLVPGGYRTT